MLVALSISTLVLTAAWAWCWRLSGTAAARQRRHEVATGVSYAMRRFGADVRSSVSLVGSPTGECTPSRVTLDLVDAETGLREVVTYGYDAGRGVVWRKSAGSYLVEGVVACRFSFFDRGGEEVPTSWAAPLSQPAADGVRRVQLLLTVDERDGTRADWSVEAGLRAWGP